MSSTAQFELWRASKPFTGEKMGDFKVTEEWVADYYRRRGLSVPTPEAHRAVEALQGAVRRAIESYPITTDVMTLRVDLPPTSNTIYSNIPNVGRVLTKEAREYKQNVLLLTKIAARAQGFGYRKGQRVGITLELYFESGNRDLGNCEKLICDSMAAALGFNDKIVDDLHIQAKSRASSDPHCDVTLKIL